MGVLVLFKEPLEEGTRGCQDHLVSSQLVIIFTGQGPVLKINDHATGGRRTKDILGGPKGWGPKKKVANVEFYVIFEVFAFCGRRTKADFKEWAFRDRATIDDRSASDLKMSSPISLRTQPGGGSFCMAASSF